MKRFTETDKWKDSWFRKLPAEVKLAYLYVLDNCDAAGVWDADYELADFQIGVAVGWPKVIDTLGDRLQILPTGKWFLTRFIPFQYGTLSPECKPHQNVLRLMKLHKTPTLSIPFPKGIQRDKEKEKEKDKDKGIEEKGVSGEKGPLQVRAEKLFRRRESTPWGSAEVKAYRANAPVIEATAEEDWKALEQFYAFRETDTLVVYRRQDLATLLNNWAGEVDKAREFLRTGPKLKPGAPYVANKAQTRAEDADFNLRYGGNNF